METDLLNSEIAPVAFFVFNRPELTAESFERIRAARPKRLFVVADGPRPTRSEDVRLCEETRKIVASTDWPCELQTNFAETNLGCRQRVSSGLNWVFEQCPEAIILEDDCVPCPSFFRFCTALLDRYRDDVRIISIGGVNFQLGHSRGNASYYFSRYTHIWGWATWKRAWCRMDIQCASWPAARDQGWLASILDDPLEVQYWTEIMERTYRGEIDSWGYPWLYSCWAQNALCAVANQNLVTNIGGGPQATHTTGDMKGLGMPTEELTEVIHPATVSRNKAADRFHWEQHILGDFRRELESRKWQNRIRKRIRIRTRIRDLFSTRKEN